MSVNAKAPLKYILRPATADESKLFYSMPEEKDAEFATVGHLRADFGDSGKKFRSTWWPHNNNELNTLPFSTELDEVINELRDHGPLKGLADMSAFCHERGGALNDGRNGYGYIAESESYRYALRFTPQRGDYNAYIYAFDKRPQEQNMAQQQPDESMTMGGMKFE